MNDKLVMEVSRLKNENMKLRSELRTIRETGALKELLGNIHDEASDLPDLIQLTIQAEEELAKILAENEQLRIGIVAADGLAKTGDALIRKMAEVVSSPEYESVWGLYHTHFGDYKGKNWMDERDEFLSALENYRRVGK